jgi:hypothetical protein
MRLRSPRPVVPSLVLAAALACGQPTGSVAAAAGTYVLASVDGCTVGTPAEQCPFPPRSWIIDGTMVLRLDGSATRAMRYRFPADPSPRTELAVGTFTVRGSAVDFALREDGGTSPYVWRNRATLSGDSLTLRYPHPADGETVEVFRRE